MNRWSPERIRLVVTVLALAAGLAVALVTPLLYFATARSYEREHLGRTAQTVVNLVGIEVYQHGDLWVFMGDRIRGRIIPHMSDDVSSTGYVVTDLAGDTIAERSFDIGWLTLSVRRPVIIAETPAAWVTVLANGDFLLVRTAITFAFSLLVGAGVFGVIRFVPFRALERAMRDRDAAQGALRALNAQLEDRIRERTAALEQAQEELLRTERLAAIGQVTATLSHELRNPLGTIRTSAMTIRDRLAEKELGLGRVIERLERNIRRCDAIIAEMLDFVRDRPLRRQSTEIGPWLREVLDELALPTGGSLEMDFDQELVAEIDREALRGAVVNLVVNAAQAMEDGTPPGAGRPVIRVEARRDGDRCRIAVRDSGSGIPDEIRPKIFDPLFSAKNFGVGLGLPLVKKMVDLHGGEIGVSTGRGWGTVMELVLPIAGERRRGDEGAMRRAMRDQGDPSPEETADANL